MTAHALLLALLILPCAPIELHPRIRTGLLASLTVGALAVTAYLRLTTCTGPAPFYEYLAIGLALALLILFAHHRHTATRHDPSLYDPWRIAP